MRLFLTALAVAAMAAAASAQQPTQEQLVERRDAKLQSAFLGKAAWITDYDKAREESRKSNKLIFAYFTRSYSP
jgi:hypothetical protein